MYKFKSRAAGDLIMLEPSGRQILNLIGKQDGAEAHQGILLPEDMPAAIVALQNAVAQDEERRAERAREARENDAVLPPQEGISLKQRALPFIDMMQRCHKANREIVWGV